jgi:UDP:flavonoid glycosyltransferase YjiC (YdhE family)
MPRIAVFPISAIGHVNPLLSVVAALTQRGDSVISSFGPASLAAAFCRAGATHVSIDPGAGAPPADGPDGPPTDLAWKSFIRPADTMAQHEQLARDFAPDVVLYDVFALAGYLTAEALGVPAAAFVTTFGYGALGEQFVEQQGVPHPQLTAVNEDYRDRFGVDVLGAGLLPVLFPSRWLSIVTGAPSLSSPLNRSETPRLYDLLSRYLDACAFVGPCIGGPRVDAEAPPAARTSADRAAAHDRGAPLPLEVLDAAKRDRRRMVLFSLGTVLTDFRFATPVGGAPTGRAFLRRTLDHLVEAFADDPDWLVVAAVGTRVDPREELRWPGNFIVRSFVPQEALLRRHADVFITHHGMNSTVESLRAGVPMVSLPGVGDQLANARIMIARGAAIAPCDIADPFGTCSAARLRAAVERAAIDPAYREACAVVAREMAAAGGADRAARLLLGIAGAIDERRTRGRQRRG